MNQYEVVIPDDRWVTSSRSANGDQCVAVAMVPGTVAVRDSKQPDQGQLRFDPGSWADFVEAVKKGEFDYPA